MDLSYHTGKHKEKIIFLHNHNVNIHNSKVEIELITQSHMKHCTGGLS